MKAGDAAHCHLELASAGHSKTLVFSIFLKFQFTIFGLFLFCKANGARILCARWPRVVELSS